VHVEIDSTANEQRVQSHERGEPTEPRSDEAAQSATISSRSAAWPDRSGASTDAPWPVAGCGYAVRSAHDGPYGSASEEAA